MTNQSNSSNDQPLNREEMRRIYNLCSKLYDQDISDEELSELNAKLESSSAVVWHYLRYTSLHNAIVASSGKLKQTELEEMRLRVEGAHHDDSPSRLSKPSVKKPKSSRFIDSPLSYVAYTAAALAAVVTLWIGGLLGNLNVQPADTAAQVSPGELSSSIDEESQVASITSRSSTITWNRSQLQVGTNLYPGDNLSLEKGELELTYRSGSKLVLVGPALFQVELEGGLLTKGGLIASVTKAGQGFTIDTPNGKVVDLGTEFGVAVDDFGVAEVSVFKGKVEAFPISRKSTSDKLELIGGESIQWDKDDLVSMEADIRRFTSPPIRLVSATTTAAMQSSLLYEFNSENHVLNDWEVLGDAALIDNQLVLTSLSDSLRPYLVTKEQFDPSRGTIRVKCHFHFKKTEREQNPAIAILTRCANERAITRWTKDGLLASCVRSSFFVDPASDSSTLLTGLKLEADTELTDISWDGFLDPVEDQTYILELEDDGVNIKCTISLKDQPWNSKSVSCRSLFRGKSNYIAIEGSKDGAIVIESFEVRQDEMDTRSFDYSEYAATQLDVYEFEQQCVAAIESLLPDGQELILSDDFNSSELDSEVWKTLGQTKLIDGQLQLGLANKEKHIDTWRSRPYLLTKSIFDPETKPVTIVGKVTFTDNFRSGYGASFAVMTRSTDQRGRGPGWEYSILKQGIRANFWPASWDPQHSLEIHEKPDANSVILLSKKEFLINPSSRTYVFRVTDDSEKVTLTMVDPKDQNIAETIEAHKTVQHDEGSIGFESCWGSPVLLDDIKIFQASSESN